MSDVAPGFREYDVLEEMTWATSAFPAPKDNARRPLEPFPDDPGNISDENLAAGMAKICSGETLPSSSRQLHRKPVEKSISML